ncbi:DMT family transporter [Enterococcus sp. LJL99]
MIWFLIPVFLGACIGTQTAVNSKLRNTIGSPLWASAISFILGTIFLYLILLLTNQSNIDLATFKDTPTWIWTGGFFGVIAITSNVYLFSVLGSIQTSILPILGQIIMGIVIDQFGLFQATKHSLNLIRFIGLILVIIGVLISSGIFIKKSVSKADDKKSNHKFFYQVWAVLTGTFIAIQSTINGALGKALHSPIQAGTVSFFLGALTLAIFLFLKKEKVDFTSLFSKKQIHNWWIWTGGILGSIYAVGNAWLVPKIGTSKTIVCALFGQLLISTLIENFGLFNSSQKKVNIYQLIAIFVLLLGTILINFSK